ncbi:hypothetical protein [Nostoc sp.]
MRSQCGLEVSPAVGCAFAKRTHQKRCSGATGVQSPEFNSEFCVTAVSVAVASQMLIPRLKSQLRVASLTEEGQMNKWV